MAEFFICSSAFAFNFRTKAGQEYRGHRMVGAFTNPVTQAVPPPGTLSVPPDGTVQVWWATVKDVSPRVLESLRSDLDAETVARTNAMVREQDRRRGIIAHGLLRRLVSATTGTNPADVGIQRTCANCGACDHGKPALVAPVGTGRPLLQFNLAHSGDVVAIALAPAGTAVGIDVEAVQANFDWLPARRHVFTGSEWNRTADAGDPTAERFALWARKEAAAKTTGHGLAIDLIHAELEDPIALAAPSGERGGVARGRLITPDQIYAVIVQDLPLPFPTMGAVATLAGSEAATVPSVSLTRADLSR